MFRNYLFSLLNNAGVSKFLRAKKRNKLTVLSLHRISDEPDFFWEPIGVAAFEKLLEYVSRYYNVISFSGIAEATLNTNHEKPFLILSFDDGYYDFYENALPLLKKFDLPANHNIVNACANENAVIWTQRLNDIFNYARNKQKDISFYVDEKKITQVDFSGDMMKFYLWAYKWLLQKPMPERLMIISEIEQRFSLSSRPRMMNWDEIAECAENRIEIGCHTYNHDVLGTIRSLDLLRQEVVQSTREIENRIGKRIEVLALPNGIGHNAIDEVAAEAGLKHILYVGEKVNDLLNYQNNGIVHTNRINMVNEKLPEMILRTALFHSNIKKYV
jgi:peptidoglycan/xylan/chitin deacetylase (PgdA/CDA1 family)